MAELLEALYKDGMLKAWFHLSMCLPKSTAAVIVVSAIELLMAGQTYVIPLSDRIAPKVWNLPVFGFREHLIGLLVDADCGDL